MPPRRTGRHKNQWSDLRASEFTYLKWNFTLETGEIKINDEVSVLIKKKSKRYSLENETKAPSQKKNTQFNQKEPN